MGIHVRERALLRWVPFLAIVFSLPLPCGIARAAEAPAAESEAGFVSLFGGKDLAGWDGNPDLWSARDGVIRGETTLEKPAKGNTFLIWRGGTLEDFELRLSFRMRSGNSGVQYRSKDRGNWSVAGYQAEVANEPGRAGFLYDERGRGRICLVGEKVAMDEQAKKQVVGTVGDLAATKASFKLNDWNDYRIVARGNHIEHYLNGLQTIDFTDDDPKGRSLSGILALQIHAGPPMLVEFRDIRLKPFPRPADQPAP